MGPYPADPGETVSAPGSGTRPELPPAHAGDLDAVLAEAFPCFCAGVADRRSAFHTPTIATMGADGAPRRRPLPPAGPVVTGISPSWR